MDNGYVYVTYKIVGRINGRWVIEGFNSQDKKLGITIIVSTASEAWATWMRLNGQSSSSSNEIVTGRAA